jgi:methyl-accepting chemotaxis protein
MDGVSEDSFEAAAGRLDRALQRLEASVRSLNGRMRTHARIEMDTQKLVNDRARYAAELDKMTAKARRLDESAHEVSRRLVDAMETVRDVLAN